MRFRRRWTSRPCFPQDNISSGFDNIADLLFVSPTTMERYLDAARKISRIAVGDPQMPPMVNIHRLSPEHWQDARVDELPFGTRGGIAVRSTFPLDGDYDIKVEVAGAGREAHQLEITVDGERRHLSTVGGAGQGWRGRSGGPASPLEFRVPVKAGVRLIGITFIERNQARDEETLKPRMRARGTKPALVSAVISGPTPWPDRATHPAGAASSYAGRSRQTCDDEPGCARQILSTLVRRAYRRPGTDAEVERLLPFYTAGGRKADSIAAFRRRSNGCWSARSSCSASSGTRRMSRPGRPIASAISSWRRACRFSSGAAFRTTSCSRWRSGGS